MTDKTASTRKARQRERDRAAGFKDVTVKVHEDDEAEIRRISAEMRRKRAENAPAQPSP